MKLLPSLLILLGLACSTQGQDYSLVGSAAKEPTTFPSITFPEPVADPKPAPKKPKSKPVLPKVPSKSRPSWDLRGSMSDAYNRSKLINHLYADPNHSGQWSKEYLQSLTLGQLWYLHDQDHNSKSRPIIKKKAPCPGGI